jgi:uncharacterized protein YkwD
MRSRIATLAFVALLPSRKVFADVGSAWASETASPRAGSSPRAGPGAIASLCPDVDAGLAAVAASLSEHRIAANDVEALSYALRAAGEPHVWPRAITLEGRTVDPRDARMRIEKWLAAFPRRGRLRCAVASAVDDGTQTTAAVAVDAQADLAPIPTSVRTASWIEVDAHVFVPASRARVVVLGPTGAPRTVPTSFAGGRVKARANVDRSGTWLFQVVVDGDTGPRPVLEAFVFAGVTPPKARPPELAPGEEAGTSADGAQALAEMVAIARRSEGLAPPASCTGLDRVARVHAERMMRAGELGHDVGDGEPRERVEEAGVRAAEIGENVAHAATLALAHRALWSSPSHRANILDRRFARLGVGMSLDLDGSVWVTEVFATPR